MAQHFISLYRSKILTATTGFEDVELALEHQDIDQILMANKMPGQDGLQATRRIRKFNQEVIIIAQTAFGLSGDMEKSIQAGCNDYISKPIIKEKLLALIQKYFGK